MTRYQHPLAPTPLRVGLLAALLAAESPLKDFIAAAFTLSPYLRDMAAADEGLLTLAISKPLEPLLAGDAS